LNVSCLWSGGKDSAYACYLALKMGFKIKSLITFYPQDPESPLFHVPNIRWTTLQAQAMNVKHHLITTPPNNEQQALEQALNELKNDDDIDGIVSGVIASNYQRRILQETCEKMGLELITPLWGLNPLDILKEVLANGFKALIVGVYAEGLTQQWLGRTLDESFIKHLEKLLQTWKVHPCGEGGEYETFVIDAPCFKKKIEVVNYEIKWHRNWGEMIILNARLVDKEHGN